MIFSKPSKSIGVDIGTHSVKAVQMSRSGGRLKVEQVGYAPVDRNQLNVDPVGAQADALREAIRLMPINQSLFVGALPGQTVVIRYPRLSEMPREQIDASIEAEAAQSIPYDLSEVFLDWHLLEEVGDPESAQLKVLVVAAKHEVIESRVQIAEAAEVQYTILGVDSLALADAAESCEFLHPGETIALVNIGLSSASIHFVKDGVSNFIRDVSWGAREMIQAIAKGRRSDYEEAERLLHSAATAASEEEALQAPEAPAEEAPRAQAEPESEQGESLLDPLSEELADLMSEPSKPAAKAGPGGAGGEKSLSEILSVPVSRLVTEVRRSFEYYEHQLYERPVDRILLSGGVAHVPVVREMLVEDLGLENVELSDPSSSALSMGLDHEVSRLRQQPAQFMVAVGLAARGTADL